MKRILIAFLSVFFANVALADNLLHINSNIVGEIVKKHIPPTKQFQALFEYNQIVKERGGITPDEIRRVCVAAGWQTDFAHAMTDGAKCDAFVEDLLKNASVKLYEVCGKEKGKSGGNEKCINDFQALTTNMIQATGLAKLYAYHKDKTQKVVCSNTARTETTNNTSTIRGGMNAGMAPMTSTTTHYVQCKALDKNIFYEFKFNNTRGTSDSTNHRSFKTGICSVFGYKFQGATKKDNREKSGWDICDGATQNACGMINNALNKAHSGYFASWGPLGRTLSTGKHGKVNEAGAGYELSASQLPYCILTANAGIKYDGTAYERTAFGLDGRYFLSKDIQTQGTAELHEYIRKYVVSRGVQIQEFSCAETYVTVKLAGRSDSDDMITCTINGSTVDFFFDDLSESKTKYVQGAKQALDCMVSGGTFTGKKCIGLGKEQCEVVRAANAVSCPECKQIKWNSETNICELPASASASKLKRGLNYTAIVGGAVVGIVITVGTLGTSSAPTIAILGGVGIETAGSVIELIAQMRIDEKADKFFTQSANCKNQTCAEKLIKDYLQELANQSDSLLDSELTTADEEFARLFDLIPSDAEFYTRIVENGIRGETVESNKRGTFEKGSWNSDQIWRAVGIGLQIIPTVASVGWKIAKKSDKLVKSTAKLRTKLTAASKHVDEALKIKDAKKLETAAKQLDDLLTQYKIQTEKMNDLLHKYDFGAIAPGNDVEFRKWHEAHPDVRQVLDERARLSQQIKQIRYENPGLWTPGEDVANYYDVENLQKKLKVFKDEEDDYISELQKRYDELSKETRGKKAYTEETWKEIGSLRAERNALLQTYDDEITQLSDELSDLLIKQQAINDGSQQQIVEQIRQVEQKRAQVIQAKQASASTNPRVIEIDKRLAELDTTYKPEAVELINEKYYIEELISDAKKTVGDKQNMVWWEAIPQEIKDKYVQYMDDTMLKTLAEDPNLALYVRNWDVVKNDERLYAEFLNDIEVKLNSDIFPQGKGVSIQTYYNPFTGQQGATNGQGAIRMNTHYYLGEDVEETIGTVKHEILGHHIDAVMPNYGLQGTTMQNAVPNFGYELNDTKRILSHGNTDANIITAKSPILGTEFSISDASEDVQHALRKDGWKVRETMDKDTYERYLGEITEREAHSITPTSNVQDKVEAWYYQKWKK